MEPTPGETLEETDFGFHYPLEYLSTVAWFLERSNFVFGWPRAGGLDDQCQFLVDDVMAWFDLREKARMEKTQPEHTDLFTGVPESEMVRTKGW